MTIELRHLRCFLAIAQELNFTRAAAVLHLSQPALSRTLTQLEQHLAVRLVDRSTHHVELTGAGDKFLIMARAAIESFVQATDPMTFRDRPLRLGYAWSALGSATPLLLQTWTQRYPQTALKLLRSDDRLAGLAAGLVDAALVRGVVGTDANGDGGLNAEWVIREARVAALPAGHALAARARVRLADLVDQVLVVNPISGTTSTALWPQHHRPRRTVETGNTDDWLMMIAGGGGVGVTSTATAQMYPHPGVVYRPLSDAPGMPVYLLWPKALPHPAIPDLLAMMKELVGHEPVAGRGENPDNQTRL